MIALELGKAPPKPRLKLVGKEDFSEAVTTKRTLDAQSRDLIYRRIRDLGRMYSLMWLVRQETASVGGTIECLDDAALGDLLSMMERARECRVEGVAFDDAGLVKDGGFCL